MKKQRISIIGDGGWGTTLAVHLSKKGQQVKLWGPFPEYIKRVRNNRYNSKFLPGIRIPSNVEITDDLKASLSECDFIVFAIPSKYSKQILKKIKETKVDIKNKVFISVTKGFDTKNLLRISEIITDEIGEVPLCVLSGPTIAVEVAKGIPSTAVIASKNLRIAKKAQELINSNTFRIYTNTDVIGVELGGSIKNVIAIACGVCDGLGFGSNTKAAILTRGLAEMSRLGKALGAKASTFSGLSGLGDLVTTCVSDKSRNRFVGEQLGKGKTINQILSKMAMVAEGVETVKAIYELSNIHKVSMPISTEVYNIIYRNKKPQKAVSDLMARETKRE